MATLPGHEFVVFQVRARRFIVQMKQPLEIHRPGHTKDQ
jgi:hypothetical protein